jgi:pilus assembly protein FimV
VPAPAAAPSVDFDLGGAAPEAQPPAPALDFDIGAATTPGGKAQPFKPGDTLVIQPGQMPPAAESGAQAKSDGLDFDISALGPVAPAQPEPAPAPAKDPSASLDFDLDLDLGTEKPAAPPAAAPVDITTISLDLGKPGAGSGDSADPRWQEVATKLDLAKAYQGMGDKEGAQRGHLPGRYGPAERGEADARRAQLEGESPHH